MIPGWKREGDRYVHEETGRCIMRPPNSRNWYVYRSDGTKDPQPYRTWRDAAYDVTQEI